MLVSPVLGVNNLTNLTNATTFYDLVEYDNQVTNGLMGTMLIIVIFIILLNTFTKSYPIEQSLLVSGFLCFGISIFLVAIDLISYLYIGFFAAIMLFSTIGIMWYRR